jgi:hypothetical protein
MNAIKTEQYQLNAVSVACAGTRFRSTVRKELGEFETLEAAKAEAQKQAARPEVKSAEAQIHFEIRHNGKIVARVEAT